MSNLSSSFTNGGTLLEVGMPPHLSGASPTTYFCSNLIWRQFMQGSKNVEQISKQIPMNVQEQQEVSLVPSRPEYTQLHVTACLGQYQAATSLLEGSPSDLNKQDHNGNTPLIWAAAEGNEEMVQLLVDSRADVNMQNFAGETPLFMAASKGYVTICSILLDNGANPNIANLDGVMPVHLAAAEGFDNVILLLLSRGAFVNAQDDAGDTPLHYAVREEQFATVKMLVTRCNASVAVMNDDQETAMELASCFECTEMVQFLSKFASASKAQPSIWQDEMETGSKHEGNMNAMFLVQGNFGW